MDFQVKKAENCFANAENYEYLTALTGADFITRLSSLGASIRINEQLRRPTFFAELASGIRIKGLLARNVLKVGYRPEEAIKQKVSFEAWLQSL